MPRPKGSRNKKSFECAARFDELVKEHGSPMDFLFEVMVNDEGSWPEIPGDTPGQYAKGPWPPQCRTMAAKELMCYRYPKLKAIEHSTADGTPLIVQTVNYADSKPEAK